MKGSRKLAAGIGTVLLACAFASAREWGGPPPPPPPPGGGPGQLGRMARDLGLSEAQQDQVRSITERYMDGALGEALEAMGAAHAALGEAIHDPEATDEQVRDKAAAVGALETRIALERHHLVAEIQQVLTPAQRKKAAELARDHAHRAPPPPPGPGGF